MTGNECNGGNGGNGGELGVDDLVRVRVRVRALDPDNPGGENILRNKGEPERSEPTTASNSPSTSTSTPASASSSDPELSNLADLKDLNVGVGDRDCDDGDDALTTNGNGERGRGGKGGERRNAAVLGLGLE